MRIKVIFALSVIVWCLPIAAEASIGHVIVAFDRAIPNYEYTYRDVRTLSKIDDFIQQKFRYDNIYISVVGYSMNGGNPDIADFVNLYTDKESHSVLWHNYNSLREIFPYWPMGEPAIMNNYYRPGSMQSLAKPYCVMETAVKDANSVADATFVIFVTDEKVQGVDDDYNREWEEMSWYNKGAYERIHDSVFEKLLQFNETYRFEFRSRKTIESEYVIASYELLPAVQPSIYSVSDLPSPLPIKRVRGGYTLACKVESHDTHYEVMDWAVYSSSGSLFKRNNEGNWFAKSNDLKDGDTLEVRMIIRMSDNLYGGFLLSRRNCPGMTIKQKIKLQDEAKVLGIMPLSDSFWWWSPSDVMTAVIIWDLLILLAIIAITVFVFYLLFVIINTYHPNNKDIKLKKL